MALPKSTNPSKGTPNLEYLAFLQDNVSENDIYNMAKFKKFNVNADAETAALVITGVPEGAQILNVHVICTAANTAGTLQLRTNEDTPVAITDAMICAVDKVVVNAGTIDDAEYVVTSDGIQVLAGGTDGTLTRGFIVIEYI